MLLVAIGWHMYNLTQSAWDLGLVGLYQFVPALLLALLAGHVVDRRHRGHIVAVCFAVQGAVALVLLLAVQVAHDTRGLLLGLSLVLGAVRAFQMPAQQALTPLLVPPLLLPRAMAFSSAGMQGAIIGGPALGGLLFVAGMGVVYGAAFVCFVAAAALVMRLHYVYTPSAREPVTLKTVLAGVDFIWKRKPVLGAVSLDLFAVLLGGAVALLPIYAKDILHTGPWGLGLLRGAPAIGALFMSIMLTRRPIERHVGRALLIAVAMFGVCMIIFGISRSFIVSLIALAVSGGADMVNVVIRQTLVQLETPDAMRGRVSAVNSIFIGASNQLGEFESGATAALLGPVGSVVAGGVGTVLVAAAWFRLFPSLAQRDRLVKLEH
jgi:MFS family permease